VITGSPWATVTAMLKTYESGKIPGSKGIDAR
jgi:hypothetical protein